MLCEAQRPPRVLLMPLSAPVDVAASRLLAAKCGVSLTNHKVAFARMKFDGERHRRKIACKSIGSNCDSFMGE